MRIPAIFAIGIVAGLGACDKAGPPDPPPVTPQTGAAIGNTGEKDALTARQAPAAEPRAVDPKPQLMAQALVMAEWEKSENRDKCAPLAFATTGSARGAPRRAEFAGGWAVAFDLPNLRSAYGIAGTGVLSGDSGPDEGDRDRLMEQWPYFRDVPQLPQPAFAGYGVEGAEAYPADNPSGRGINSLAYLRVGSQECLYNVWSRLGRAHLETLLRELRAVRQD